MDFKNKWLLSALSTLILIVLIGIAFVISNADYKQWIFFIGILSTSLLAINGLICILRPMEKGELRQYLIPSTFFAIATGCFFLDTMFKKEVLAFLSALFLIVGFFLFLPSCDDQVHQTRRE